MFRSHGTLIHRHAHFLPIPAIHNLLHFPAYRSGSGQRVRRQQGDRQQVGLGRHRSRWHRHIGLRRPCYHCASTCQIKRPDPAGGVQLGRSYQRKITWQTNPSYLIITYISAPRLAASVTIIPPTRSLFFICRTLISLALFCNEVSNVPHCSLSTSDCFFSAVASFRESLS